ncbi:MAG TPA: discoidin domain-containing protein [Casimicrobiaceae bacterium]|nr:discoidin domain-containing protein [Casimicrobiaceae bacterium]
MIPLADTGPRRPGRVLIAIVAIALAAALALGRAGAQSPGAPPRLLDDFGELSSWHAGASDGVRASIHSAEGIDGRALQLDFDLAGTAGYALAARALPLDLPANYELSFYVRADAPVNNFQFKLTDAAGDNVWWFNRPDFTFPRDWREVRIRKRQIEFAWGPTADRTLRHAARLEFVVAAGRGGGAGSVRFSRLTVRELPAVPAIWPTPTVHASSTRPGSDPARAVDGQAATAWRSDPGGGLAQSLTLDFGQRREFGGIVLHWLDGEFASRYEVQVSDDGAQWRTLRSVTDGSGGNDALALPEAESRYLRLSLQGGPAGAYGLAEVEIKDPDFGESANAFVEAVARNSPRGYFPRGFSGEQVYWTLVGVDGGSDSALLSTDGALEAGQGGFSIEPFVVAGGKLVTWADTDTHPFLPDGYLPMPGVRWRQPQWELSVSSFASGTRASSRIVSRYRITNRTGDRLPLQLVLAIRPFQVNPPTQFLNTVGGVSAIRDIAWDGTAFTVNDRRKVYALQRPDKVAAFASDPAALPKLLARSAWVEANRAHDAFGYASGAFAYKLDLPPHGSRTIDLVIPLSGSGGPALRHTSGEAWVAREQRTTAAAWREKLNRVSLEVPPAAQPLVDALRTSFAHILMTRDGAMLRPGTRSYARSWIRDGAMIGESLLRLGDASVAAEYLRWYAPHQFATGKIPCCVDRRGADPVPENDSAGEFIFLAAETYRYTRDRALIGSMWPHVQAAARYLDLLRDSERIDVNLAPDRRSFYGLLPASISHEGYSEKPMHSYWDDFWALKGYDGAVDIANALGHGAEADRLRAEREGFRRDLVDSLHAAVAARGIDYLPGAAELGDFDPTSTAIAFAPRGDTSALPPDLVRATYERYWREFVDRRDGKIAWDVYTPYELRIVGTLVRLGWRDRAQALLTFFLANRRPLAWNQWPEVVGRDPRQARFVGDMPHAWVASDFIRATLDLFAYERDADRAIVLAAGIAPAWLEQGGVAVQNLRTPYGRLSYTLRRDGGLVTLRLAPGSGMPPGGFKFVWPGDKPPISATINGKPASFSGAELHIAASPARVLIDGR